MHRRLFQFVCTAALIGSLPAFALAAEGATAGDAKPVATAPAASAAPLPGHSAHGAAFDDGPRQAAHLIPGCGNVSIQVTTKSPEAQQFFNQGLGQLHGFWYFEAERSFRQAAQLDPDCAMAYWGMALANINNAKRARQFIEQATKRRAKASPREQAWIDAWATYYREPPAAKADKPKEASPAVAKPVPATTGDKPATPAKPAAPAASAVAAKANPPAKPDATKAQETERRRKLVRALEDITFDYPDEVEAKAQLAVLIWQNREHNLPISSHRAVDALLGEVFATVPNHPAHHYRIHLWDDEKPLRAVKSAAQCGQAAPAIAHMWHMPGHTYSKLHRYRDAAWQQEAATRTDHAYMIANRVMPDEIHNYAHNQEWLIRTLGLLGRAHQGVALAKNMTELPRHPRYNTASKGKGSASFGRTRLIETLSTFELWDELIALADTPYLEKRDERADELPRVRALGTAYYLTGKREQGDTQLRTLETWLAEEKKPKSTDKKDDKTAAAKQPDEKKPADAKNAVADKKTDDGKNASKLVTDLERAIDELRGHRATSEEQWDEALKHLERAKVSREVLSRANLAAGKRDEAEKLARQAATADKDQAYPRANLVDVLNRLEKHDEAAKELAELRRVGGKMDLDLPVIARIASVIAREKLSGDWRTKPTDATDVGVRPQLDSLGPVTWTPPAAPKLGEFTTAEGKKLRWDDYRGKPVVLVFYLGKSCLHCVEQLKKFAPAAGKFRDAGIELLGVSTDGPEALETSWTSFASDGEFPFPLVSDAGMERFKAYGAYDDFERVPLHATVVVDGRGRIVWQDIGAEPFTDVDFVLKEARRQLSFPRP
ncbi:MAG: redoxin domain-containing protein [Planctomycetes bacterium]|nr:redoxin domain-containing protein [Planctomycetota bacterium]